MASMKSIIELTEPILSLYHNYYYYFLLKYFLTIFSFLGTSKLPNTADDAQKAC